jgi:hypothetical protein
MKDDKKLVEVEGNDVHVEPKGAKMLTQIDVSLKELNMLKRKSELVNANEY